MVREKGRWAQLFKATQLAGFPRWLADIKFKPFPSQISVGQVKECGVLCWFERRVVALFEATQRWAPQGLPDNIAIGQICMYKSSPSQVSIDIRWAEGRIVWVTTVTVKS